jgi:hypothetical protein
MAVRVHDAPRGDEILVVVILTNAGRPLARVGGLKRKRSAFETGYANL